MNKQEKDRERRRKKRVDEAMREKRRAFEENQRERAKLRRERIAQRKKTNSTEEQVEGGSEEKGESKVEITPKTDGSPTKDELDLKPTQSKEKGEEGQTDRQMDDNEPEALAKGFSKLDIDQTPASSDESVPPLDDDEYASPVEAPDELDDNDFDWDSEMYVYVLLN